MWPRRLRRVGKPVQRNASISGQSGTAGSTVLAGCAAITSTWGSRSRPRRATPTATPRRRAGRARRLRCPVLPEPLCERRVFAQMLFCPRFHLTDTCRSQIIRSCDHRPHSPRSCSACCLNPAPSRTTASRPGKMLWGAIPLELRSKSAHRSARRRLAVTSARNPRRSGRTTPTPMIAACARAVFHRHT